METVKSTVLERADRVLSRQPGTEASEMFDVGANRPLRDSYVTGIRSRTTDTVDRRTVVA